MPVTTGASAPASVSSNPVKHLALDLTILVIVLVGLCLVYKWIDPSELRDGSIFPWDSGVYRVVADALPNWNLSNPVIAAYPWGPRLLFPAAYSALANVTGLGDFQAAYAVEVAAVLVVSAATFAFWRRSQISRPLAWIGILLISLAWVGPLRYAGLFPGSGFASQMLTVWTVFAAIVLVRKGGLWRVLTASGLIFLAALSREFAAYILVFIVMLALLGKLAQRNNFNVKRLAIVQTAMLRLTSRPMSGLIILMCVSLLGYGLARFIVQDPASTYSAARTAVSYGYFHLNIMELLYPFLYGLGPFVLALLVTLTFASTRHALADRLRNQVTNLDLVLIFILVGVIFAIFGGTDSDRFILWMFPFFGLLGLHSVAVLRDIGGRRITVALIALLAVGLLWTRFYVPAIPHVFFPGGNYCAQAGVRTNYDPSLYTGPPFMADLREPLITVPVDPEQINPPERYASDATAQIPSGCDPQGAVPVSEAYKGDVNTVPIPFGFAHNQYELLVAHPYHGKWQVRAGLMAQWAIVYLALIALIRVPARSRRPGRQLSEADSN